MPIQAKVSGAWHSTYPQVRASGAWHDSNVWVKVSGVWKRANLVAAYALPSTGCYDFAFGTFAQANLSLLGDGTFITAGMNIGTTESGNWVTPTSYAVNPGGYTIRAHLASGDTPTGPAFDTDLALNTARTWYLAQSGAGTKACTLDLTLKDSLGYVVAVQYGVPLNADVY